MKYLPKKRKILQLLFGFFFFIIAIRQIDFHTISAYLQGCQPIFLIIALLVTILSILIRLIFRKYLLGIFAEIDFKVVVKAFFANSYLSNFLPARIGGIFGEPWGLYSFSKSKIRFSDALAFSIIIILVQNFRKIILTLLGLIWFFSIFPFYYNLIIGLAILMYFGYSFLFFWALFPLMNLNGLIGSIKSILPAKAISLFKSLSEMSKETSTSARYFFKYPQKTIFGLSALVIISSLLESLRMWLLLLSFGVSFNFLYLILIPSLAYSVTAFPITPGGFGVAEISGLLVFKSLGIPSEIAVSVIFLDRMLSTYWAFLFGAFLLPYLKLPTISDFALPGKKNL